MTSGFTVFVCSTFHDLADERDGVLIAIRRLQLQHDSMEFFGARTDQPIETCLSEVRRSNIIVVIVGHRYGTLVPGLDISFPEAEYKEGFTLGKPCLVYMRDDNVPILPKHMERESDKLRLLNSWKQVLLRRHTVATFRDSHDLAVQVTADLGRTIASLDKAARTRKEAESSEHSLLGELSTLVTGAVAAGVGEQALLSSLRRAISEAIAKTQELGARVFLSHAASDKYVVRKVADGLRRQGFQVWFDESALKPGVQWVREIERGLDSADFVVFFISKSSVTRPWVQQEMDIALHRQIAGGERTLLLPVLLEHADVPPFLRQIQWLDMTDGDIDRGLAQLVNVMHHHLGREYRE